EAALLLSEPAEHRGAINGLRMVGDHTLQVSSKPTVAADVRTPEPPGEPHRGRCWLAFLVPRRRGADQTEAGQLRAPGIRCSEVQHAREHCRKGSGGPGSVRAWI